MGSTQNFYRKQQTESCLFCIENSFTQKREVQIYFAGNMADARMYAEEEHRPGQPLNEEGNVRDGEF